MGDFGKSLVKLNVGGTVFETRLETLDRGSKQGSRVCRIAYAHVRLIESRIIINCFDY